MNSMQMIDCFNLMEDKSWWPLKWPDDPDQQDSLVLLMVAAVILSGFECETEEDLKNAVNHFMSLMSSGVYTPRRWAEIAVKIEHELMTWGDDFQAERDRITESN